jgi:hypothetical protein
VSTWAKRFGSVRLVNWLFRFVSFGPFRSFRFASDWVRVTRGTDFASWTVLGVVGAAGGGS